MRTNGTEPIYPQDAALRGFTGLTKREYFAALFMAGMEARSGLGGSNEAFASAAVRAADALIVALNAPKEKEQTDER